MVRFVFFLAVVGSKHSRDGLLDEIGPVVETDFSLNLGIDRANHQSNGHMISSVVSLLFSSF